jgi:hypothetical protein
MCRVLLPTQVRFPDLRRRLGAAPLKAPFEVLTGPIAAPHTPEGVARPEDVDGMFQMVDMVGLDVVLDIENHSAEDFPHLPDDVRDLPRSYVDAGRY